MFSLRSPLWHVMQFVVVILPPLEPVLLSRALVSPVLLSWYVFFFSFFEFGGWGRVLFLVWERQMAGRGRRDQEVVR